MTDVHRRLAYLIAWAVAASVTAGIAWLGIRSVLVAASPTRTVPLSAVQLRRIAPPPSPGTPLPNGAGGAPSSLSTGQPGQSQAEIWSQTDNGFKRTFRTAGGEVAFFTGKDSVQVVSSAANPGYTVNVTRYSGDSVMVSFFGNRKTSRVWVRWWNGPYAEITESIT